MELVNPNFLIVGAAKCGTTTLYSWLKSHPDVFMPWLKEPSYFVEDEHKHNISQIESLEGYLSLFLKADRAKAIGEASTLYLYSQVAASKIKKHFGNKIKIIIALREPIQMVYSLWRHNVRGCYEFLSFEEALAKENERFNSQDFRITHWNAPNFFYTRRALFSVQVKRYLEQFPRKNILFVKLDDLDKHPENTYRNVLEFLGVEYYPLKSFSIKNKGGKPRSVFLENILSQRNHVFRLPFKLFLPNKLRQHLRMLIAIWNHKVEKAQPIDSKLENRLRDLFSSDLILLEEITGLNLSDWKSSVPT